VSRFDTSDERGSVAVTQSWARPTPARTEAPGTDDRVSGHGPRVCTTRDELDESTLVVRAQEGDAGAFEALARRHQATLYRVAVRVLGDRVEAEDAVQEALVDAWRRIERFRGDAAFSTWMYRIVTNTCLGMLRGRRPVPVDELDDRVLAPDSPERSAELDAGLAALGRAVQSLSADLRVCWVLRELEGLGYSDIAQITGASEDAVRGRIHRARIRLAEVMRPWR
jgi:RNA polymerase sigma-70 factor, ECF subfamily